MQMTQEEARERANKVLTLRDEHTKNIGATPKEMVISPQDWIAMAMVLHTNKPYDEFNVNHIDLGNLVNNGTLYSPCFKGVKLGVNEGLLIYALQRDLFSKDKTTTVVELNYHHYLTRKSWSPLTDPERWGNV